MPRTFLVVHGVVQGVGYRRFVAGKAREHLIRGFVRNSSDGSVEILADYWDRRDIEAFIDEISVDTKHGPQVFKIENDDARLAEFFSKTFLDFEIEK
jgi:acylphosphatase